MEAHGPASPESNAYKLKNCMIIEDPIVLLVDDLRPATELMCTVFERAGYVQPLRLAYDGEQAIAYLSGDGASGTFRELGMPTVVLLDLNMPKKNGFEVLEWIREQPALKQLFVCVLSASSEPEDIARAYALGANSYLVKPSNLTGLLQMASCLLAWLRLVHFAPASEPNALRVHQAQPGLRCASMG